MIAWLLGLLSVVIISLVSAVGIFTLWLNDSKLRKVLLYLVSFSAGSLFGDAFIHLIPEATEGNGFTTNVSVLIIIGILSSFFMERVLQWRHCHIPTTSEHPHHLAYMNLFGDSVHNLIDGLIVGGSYLASVPIGVSTTLAVVFHEIPQELGDFGVLVYGGFSRRKALWFNFLTALTSVIGASVSLVLGSVLGDFVSLLIPFAAGNFIYIAGSDLIPELRKDIPELKKAGLQMASLVLGVVTMFLLLQLG
jgi:zinc and cadmium transporter